MLVLRLKVCFADDCLGFAMSNFFQKTEDNQNHYETQREGGHNTDTLQITHGALGEDQSDRQ